MMERRAKPRRGKRAAISSVLYRLLFGILVFASIAASAEAAGGVVITDISGRAYALVRCNSDGTLDASFGNGGKLSED